MTKTTRSVEEERTAVAVRPNGAVVVHEDVPELDGFGQSDVTIPICSLVQPMSQNKGEAGRYSFPDGRSLADMRVVLLYMMPTRAVWADIKEGINEPLCRSADRKLGYTRYADRIRTGAAQAKPSEDRAELECATCRLGPTNVTFAKSEDGLWCPDNYTLLLADYETAQPFLFFVKGMAFKEVKAKMVSPTITETKTTGVYAPWRRAYSWNIKLVEEPGKKYYTPIIVPDVDLEPEHAAFYEAMSLELRPRAKSQVIEDAPPADEGQRGFEA